MRQYLEFMEHILEHGELVQNRTGIRTISIFGGQIGYNLSEGFPLLTTKRVFFRGIVEELIWILSGSTDVADLQKRGIKIWDEWATEEECAKYGRPEGKMGPIYGHQWRNFGATPIIEDGVGIPRKPGVWRWQSDGHDQIVQAFNDLRFNPTSRRIIVTAWHPKEANQVTLPPCHTLFQFRVLGGKLHLQLYQRSADYFLGVPFNMASYSLLLLLFAHCLNLEPGNFIHTFGDVHIYENHKEQCLLQLSRSPMDLPNIEIAPGIQHPTEASSDTFSLVGYKHHPAIAAKVAV